MLNDHGCEQEQSSELKWIYIDALGKHLSRFKTEPGFEEN